MTTAEQLTYALDRERAAPEPADDGEHWAAALFDRHGRWTRVATQPYRGARNDQAIARPPQSPSPPPPR